MRTGLRFGFIRGFVFELKLMRLFRFLVAVFLFLALYKQRTRSANAISSMCGTLTG